MAKARRTRSRPETKPARSSRRPPQPAQAAPAPIRPVTALPPPPVQRTASADAVNLYERGLEALQRHAFADAATQLRNLISKFPEERELNERAHVYLRLCERELAAAPPSMSIEERVTAATVAVNAGDYQRARSLLDSILRERPDHDLAEYMTAVVSVATGDGDAAVSHLDRAIALNRENRNLARQDEDFESLHERDDFRRLIESPGPPRRRRPRLR